MLEPLHVARLTDRALIRVAGPDARAFLQGLLTQEVETQAEGELRYGALLNAQGRLIQAMFLRGEADGVLLDVDAAAREGLAARLAMYRLRAKVTVEAVEGGVWAAWEPPPPPSAVPLPRFAEEEEWAADSRLPTLGWRAYGNVQAVETAAPDAYDAHRLALGVPEPARDCPDDKTYPIEANLDLLNGIDFRKGCFVGQETTSRMKRRGAIKSRIAPLAFDGPAPAFGAEVLAGALRAGEVRAGRDGRALALLRIDRLDAGPLTVAGRPVRVDAPDWLQPAFRLEALTTAET